MYIPGVSESQEVFQRPHDNGTLPWMEIHRHPTDVTEGHDDRGGRQLKWVSPGFGMTLSSRLTPCWICQLLQPFCLKVALRQFSLSHRLSQSQSVLALCTDVFVGKFCDPWLSWVELGWPLPAPTNAVHSMLVHRTTFMQNSSSNWQIQQARQRVIPHQENPVEASHPVPEGRQEAQATEAAVIPQWLLSQLRMIWS